VLRPPSGTSLPESSPARQALAELLDLALDADHQVATAFEITEAVLGVAEAER